MALDPTTMLTLAALLLGLLGVPMILSSHGSRSGAVLRWWGVAFLVGAVGFALILASPAAMRSPARVTGNALVALAYGLLWAAARARGGRPFEGGRAVAGAAGWIAAIVLFDPDLGWRIGLSSAIVGLYSAATAKAVRPDGTARVRAEVWASRILSLHSAFYLLRAALGPTAGFLAWGQDIAQGWSALLGLESVLFAALFGPLAIAMSREPPTQVHPEALEDRLTNIGNRRALFRSGTALMADAARAGRPLALLTMDLDGFGRVNDLHGHDAGDRLLVAFARLAHDYLPPTSLVCRLGGEAFAAVLPGADPARARAVADELRGLFSHLAIEGAAGPIGTTVSIGIAQIEQGRTGMDELLERAERGLHAAKVGGRNRVVHEAETPTGGRRSAA